MRDWVAEAALRFAAPKPGEFTDSTHCDECAEHNETLLNEDLDTIGLEELGNPGWDPITLSSVAGKLYYMPAMIRLSLESLDGEFYFSQFLFHLRWDGPDNMLLQACSPAQRSLVADFVAYMIESHPQQLDNYLASDDAIDAHQIWAAGK
jgi:hypothetical protein